MSAALRLGTRRSRLARTQAQQVADALTASSGREVVLVDVVTEGDTTPGSLAALGGTGVFATALRDALRRGEVDLAVHSLKDLPTAPAEGLALAAVPTREDARDVLVARDGLTLTGPDALPGGATVGTGSPRRAAMLRATGRDLTVVDVRGNVDTRLRLVSDGELDAVVLARAGLARLGRLDEVTEVLDPDVVLPAPGQGALAVETREDDSATRALVAPLDDSATRACVTAERAVLAALEAGCSAPVGAHAVVAGTTGTTSTTAAGEPRAALHTAQLHIRAAVVAVDGSAQVRQSATGAAHDAEGLGRALAAELLAAGAPGLLGERLP